MSSIRAAVVVFLAFSLLPAAGSARQPTYLELKVEPNPAGIGQQIRIECRLWVKSETGAKLRVEGGLLNVSVYDLQRDLLVSQFVDKPNGQFDIFEFPWKGSSPGTYKIEVSYTGSAFHAGVRASENLRVSLKPAPAKPEPKVEPRLVPKPAPPLPRPQAQPVPERQPLPVETKPPLQAAKPAATGQAIPSGPKQPVPEAKEQGSLSKAPETTVALAENSIEPEQPRTGEASSTQEPSRSGPAVVQGKIVTKVVLAARPGTKKGEYLITVRVLTADDFGVEEGEVMISVTAGRLEQGHGGPALLSAAAGPQVLTWTAPDKATNQPMRLEATYFGGPGPGGEYHPSSTAINLPPETD